MAKRPLRARVWVYRPQWHWFGLRTLIPVYTGADEWDWHTIVFGWTVTGRVVIATHRCRQTGKCKDLERLNPDWPTEWWEEEWERQETLDGLFPTSPEYTPKGEG